MQPVESIPPLTTAKQFVSRYERVNITRDPSNYHHSATDLPALTLPVDKPVAMFKPRAAVAQAPLVERVEPIILIKGNAQRETHVKHPGLGNTMQLGSGGEGVKLYKKRKDRTNYLDTARSLLNKLTKQNFDDVIVDLFGLLVNREVLTQVVDIVYEKAIQERKFRGLYANVCSAIKECERTTGTTWDDGSSFTNSPAPQEDDKQPEQRSVFREVLVKKCQQEIFNKPHEPLTEEQHSTMTEKQIEEWEEIRRLDILGNVEFIGILVNQSILAPNVAIQSHFLKMIGAMMQSQAFERFKSLLDFLKPFLDAGKLESQTKYALKDGLINRKTRPLHLGNKHLLPHKHGTRRRMMREAVGDDSKCEDDRMVGRVEGPQPAAQPKPKIVRSSWKEKAEKKEQLMERPKAVRRGGTAEEEDLMNVENVVDFGTDDNEVSETLPLPEPSPSISGEERIAAELEGVSGMVQEMMSSTGRITNSEVGKFALQTEGVQDEQRICYTRQLLAELLGYVLASCTVKDERDENTERLVGRMQAFLSAFFSRFPRTLGESVEVVSGFDLEYRCYQKILQCRKEGNLPLDEIQMRDDAMNQMLVRQMGTTLTLSKPIRFHLSTLPPTVFKPLYTATLTNASFLHTISLMMQTILMEWLANFENGSDFVKLANFFRLPGQSMLTALRNCLKEDPSMAGSIVDGIRRENFTWCMNEVSLLQSEQEVNSDEDKSGSEGAVLLKRVVRSSGSSLSRLGGFIARNDECRAELGMFLDELIVETLIDRLLASLDMSHPSLFGEDAGTYKNSFCNTLKLGELDPKLTSHVVATVVRVLSIVCWQLGDALSSFDQRFHVGDTEQSM
ncbi:putative MIF4G domain containing protein [Blattamonas nauphoetae]|uniref:MIF4G domain containing protein n=1 Tax=Blattamonas nauphoetae TaxID=2049346 RepID=A0ABQ9YJ00_9EUKA|nr:putative MIF4G domain containing protein [Blattamonas nauphoetae]